MSSEAQDSPPPSENGSSGGASAVTPAPPPAGLPTVSPPSGKLMLQLFLVPGLIVAFLIGAWLVGGWLFGVSYSKKDFLDKLNDPNAEVRWRAAENLAQVLLRDDALASDADFARQLGLMLNKARDESAPAEKAYIEFLASVAKEGLNEQQRKEKVDAERRKLDPQRMFIMFLDASLGDFLVPVGAPILKELASQKEGMDPNGLALRRRQAVWALANLGENQKRFDALPNQPGVVDQLRTALWDAAQPGGSRDDFLKLSADDKDAALDKLDLTTGPAKSAHADWLRDALHALRQRAKKDNDDMGVGAVLIACSEDKDDPYLRELSAFAMNFWRGDAAADAAMEKRLVELTFDDGAGQNKLAELSDDKDDSPTVSIARPDGLQIQYDAAVALARFGGKQTRLDVLKDMLDENALKSKFVLRPRDRGDDASQDKPNDEVIGQTLTNALKAVAELHKLRPEMDLSSLKPAVDALASGSGNPAVRSEAEATRLALNS